MRKLFHCRRGSVAFGVLAAMIPLVGMIGIGAEAGSWYVVKTSAQNAADAAAMAGALQLANFQTGWSAAGTASAALNGVPTAAVAMSQPALNQVKATVTRTVPQSLTKLFYKNTNSDGTTGTVQIQAVAVAQIILIANPCILALKGPISFGGSANVNASSCGFLSDGTTTATGVKFQGSGTSINAPVASAGGCTQNGSADNCKNVLTYGATVPDPLSALNTALSGLAINATNFPGGQCVTPGPVAFSTATTATKCYNGTPAKGNGNGNSGGYSFPSATLSGTYFFAGPVSIGSNTVITGTATLILLPGATLTMTGNPKVTLNGQSSVPATSVPAVLNTAALLSKMAGLLIYDPETTTGNGSNGTVDITGNSASYFNGVVYAPNASVTYTGSSSSSSGTGCNQVIAASVTYTGSTSYLNNSACPTSLTSLLNDQYVSLVQ